MQIPKVQKDSQVILCLFALLGSGQVKAALQMLVKLNQKLDTSFIRVV
jgi:hypothetical protein